MFETRNQKLATILEAMPASVDVPPSALKTLRGSRHQTEIALKSGVSQAHISELETGKKWLTPRVSAKLAPVLGCETEELLATERVSALKRMADGGHLDPDRLVVTIMDLAFVLPDARVSDDLIDSMLAVLNQALVTYEGEEGRTPRDAWRPVT